MMDAVAGLYILGKIHIAHLLLQGPPSNPEGKNWPSGRATQSHSLPARLVVSICLGVCQGNKFGVCVPYCVQGEGMAAEQGELEQQLEQHEAQPGTAGNDEVADAQAVAACPPNSLQHAPFGQERPQPDPRLPRQCAGPCISAGSAG